MIKKMVKGLIFIKMEIKLLENIIMESHVVLILDIVEMEINIKLNINFFIIIYLNLSIC